jgi:hypothetical protein
MVRTRSTSAILLGNPSDARIAPTVHVGTETLREPLDAEPFVTDLIQTGGEHPFRPVRGKAVQPCRRQTV